MKKSWILAMILAAMPLANAHSTLLIPTDCDKFPLHCAIEKGDPVSSIKKLIDNGVDIEAKSKNMRPLDVAVKSGKTEIVRLLLNEGADFTAYSIAEEAVQRSLENELYLSIHQGDLSRVTSLIEAERLDVNLKYIEIYGSPIIHAVSTGRNEILKYLLEKGADVSFKGSDGMTALDKAKEWGNISAIEILTPYYKNANNTALLKQLKLQKRLFEALKNNDTVEVSAAIKNGAKVNVDCKKMISIAIETCPALNYAIQQNNTAMMQLLVEAGADINDEFAGLTMIGQAAWMGKTKAALWLIERGAKIEARGRLDRTALQNAAYANDIQIINTLLDRGANIEASNIDGTPLIWAANAGSVEAVRLLVERGANVYAVTRSGLTASKIANRHIGRALTQDRARFQEIANYLALLEEASPASPK